MTYALLEGIQRASLGELLVDRHVSDGDVAASGEPFNGDAGENQRAAARQDMSGGRQGESLEVARWFDYAQARVPELATAIGRRQVPTYQKTAVNGFPIGRVTPDVRSSLSLGTRPLVGPPSFIDQALKTDERGLGQVVGAQLSSLSKHSETGMAYVDVRGLHWTYLAGGIYESEPSGGIRLRSGGVSRNGKPFHSLTPVTGSVSDVAAEIARQVARSIREVETKEAQE